jgi:hypothetical protein
MNRHNKNSPNTPHRFPRRDLLAGAAFGLAAAGLGNLGGRGALAIDVDQAPAEAAGLSAYQGDRQVFVRWNNSVIISYRAPTSAKFPYFGPLIGPASGISLTTESSLPYPHQRGVWLGCEPLIGGDYWSDNALDEGQILSSGPTLGTVGNSFATFTDNCEWVRRGAPSPLADRRKIIVRIPSKRMYAVDIDIDLTAREDIHIESAKHSFFALRAAADISPIGGGVLMNSKGDVGANATYGRTATWCGYHGARQPSKAVEGIAIFNHPENFGGDCPWFTRNYGHLSPSPFNFLTKPWSLAKGAHLNLKYCVVLHSGTPQEADLDKVYQEWVSGKGRFVAAWSG